jgi:hypothetical protein
MMGIGIPGLLKTTRFVGSRPTSPTNLEKIMELLEIETLRAENEKLKAENMKLKTERVKLQAKNKELQKFYDNAPGGGKYSGDNFGNDFSW